MAFAAMAVAFTGVCRLSTTLLGLAVAVSGTRVRGGHDLNAKKGCSELLPFDCYVNKGADYEGLLHMTTSGRTCKNWLKEGTYPATTKGIGNHNYCRNPTGSKDKPWCYTLDPAIAWEYCDVPECQPSATAPQPWRAPSGAKSSAAEAAGPCTYTPPVAPMFSEHKAGRACMDHRGDTWWLISNQNFTAADSATCGSKCLELPGTEYFTFWKAAATGNCGCYRECILVPKDMTVDSPTTFRVK
uniref:Kringle domain-containing protein n=1 Tax=Alexandrium andersonii TaxID=327968 RepID=A0A7S2MNW0_9DINO|mmetsp:Transcript_72825/g.163057  ORF Transcript_72825/g.163057 Transcript_72825/m.163057 type:complete len:243 (+) Transcript_72825:54-782(+)